MKLRSQSGFHSAELVGGLLILVPIVLYALDYATVLYGGQMNSSCCSAACRAAAQGPPTGFASDASNTPKNRAMSVLKRMAQANSVVRVKQTVRLREIIQNPTPKAPYGGPFMGTITVKTRCDVFPPFLLPMMPKNVTLYTSQTYPWTYSMASSFENTEAGGGGPNPMTPGILTGSPPPPIGTSGPVNDIAQPIPANAP
jgi:hypothetical protein